MDSNQGLAALLGSVKLLLELWWRSVAEVAVQPLGVVPVVPAEGAELDVLSGAPRP